jgi:hypothetical protein
MTNRDPHPLIKWQATHDGWGEGEEIHPEAFSLFHRAKSVLQSPQERMQVLRNLDSIIGADDGTSLRSKAELLNIRRGLAQTHHHLSKAGR